MHGPEGPPASRGCSVFGVDGSEFETKQMHYTYYLQGATVVSLAAACSQIIDLREAMQRRTGVSGIDFVSLLMRSLAEAT